MHQTLDGIEAWLDVIRQSPCAQGVVELIVRRPRSGDREVLDECQLDCIDGLVGDSWKSRSPASATAKASYGDVQLTVMNSRVIQCLACDKDRWPLAGDQLFVDLDLSVANLPPGTRISVGTAVIKVTAEPHTGCKKFADRFGPEALRFVNSDVGRQLNLRGINTKIIQAGVVRLGDFAVKRSRDL